jgi:hypothetical protein
MRDLTGGSRGRTAGERCTSIECAVLTSPGRLGFMFGPREEWTTSWRWTEITVMVCWWSEQVTFPWGTPTTHLPGF